MIYKVSIFWSDYASYSKLSTNIDDFFTYFIIFSFILLKIKYIYVKFYFLNFIFSQFTVGRGSCTWFACAWLAAGRPGIGRTAEHPGQRQCWPKVRGAGPNGRCARSGAGKACKSTGAEPSNAHPDWQGMFIWIFINIGNIFI